MGFISIILSNYPRNRQRATIATNAGDYIVDLWPAEGAPYVTYEAFCDIAAATFQRYTPIETEAARLAVTKALAEALSGTFVKLW